MRTWTEKCSLHITWHKSKCSAVIITSNARMTIWSYFCVMIYNLVTQKHSPVFFEINHKLKGEISRSIEICYQCRVCPRNNRKLQIQLSTILHLCRSRIADEYEKSIALCKNYGIILLKTYDGTSFQVIYISKDMKVSSPKQLNFV